jgi:probable biosynthetic protein (TIGR04098 family)
MHTETTELTYSHQDLGPLNEFGLMCLFGSLHSKALVRGLGRTVEDIRDQHGRRLYPAYFYTHLKVPEAFPLSRFAAWQNVQLGVEVQRFGKCYLDSRYVIKPASDAPLTSDDLATTAYPTMHGDNLFIVDVTEDTSVARQLAVPAADCVAPLDSVKEKPVAIQRARDVARDRVIRHGQSYPLSARESIAYRVVPGRDVANGHAMIFARFSQVMDFAEHIFLSDHLELAWGDAELAEYQLTEREIFYFSNACAGDIIDLGVRARLTDEVAGERQSTYVETEYQLFRRSNLELLAVGYARKRLAGPRAAAAFAALASGTRSVAGHRIHEGALPGGAVATTT